MGFSGEVDDTIGLEVINHRLNQIGVSDIAFNKLISRIVCHGDQIIKVTSVGEFVKVEDVVFGFGDLFQDEVATDEACATCDNYFFQFYPNISQLFR